MITYCVTGANGFVGSYVVKELLKNPNHFVIGLVKPFSNLSRLANVQGNFFLHEMDYLADFLNLGPIKDYAIDYMIHTAWIGVFNSFKNDESQRLNQVMTQSVLKILSYFKIKRLVCLGSQAEYGESLLTSSPGPIAETAPLKPVTLYGKEKVKAHQTIQDFCERNGITYQWLRLFSTYGPSDNPKWLIPHVISSFLENKRPLLTLGTQKWDYLYIEDVAKALIESCFLQENGIYNLGSGIAVSIKEITQTIYDIIRPSIQLQFGQRPFSEDQIFHLQANINLFFSKSNWTPTISLEQGLLQTISSLYS